MASLADDDDIEESVQDGVPSKKVQSRDLKSGVLLGKGASSIVYETTWKGKSYARKDFLRVPSDIFEREAAFLVALDDHPNVVRTYGWTVDEGSCSLVVEWMDDDLLNLMRKRNVSQLKHFSGPSDASQRSHLIDLHKFVEDGKNAPAGTGSESVASTSVYRFSMPEALHVMLQIAEGIVFLHDHGVAHGDLKPKNILVTPSERAISGSLDQDVAFKLKVADFGLVGTKIKSKSLVSRRARRLEILRWRAPELFKDMSPLKGGDLESFTDSSDWDSDSSDGRIGGRIHKFSYGKLARADVYSFALTCSQILTGEDPYQGIGLNDLVRRIPLGLRPGLPRRCPAQLSDLINRCWGEELKRPTFIGIRSELKDLQASLMGDSWVDIKKTTITGPDFELTVSLKYVTGKFANKQSGEKLLRGQEIHEKVDLPIGPEKPSIMDSQESSKVIFVPKKRRRRKVYGCLGSLGCIPAITGSSRENEDIPTPMKRNAKLARHKRSPFDKVLSSKTFSPNDKRYFAEIGRTIEAKSYTRAEVIAMTRNFKAKIGKGGFGTVYYGKLPDGQKVAVKVGEVSGNQRSQEFFNEIDVLSRVRHKNLVALVGYYQKKNDYVLIYEYMNNGSLRDHLSGKTRNAGILDWKTRLRIALNTAQGLEYLHIGSEQNFVHGDMKSSNILLSAKYDAKLTDFGLTKRMGDDTLVITTFVKGTAGYLDPEFYSTQRLSTKSDIYSFGVVLLEVITGRPPIQHTDSSSRMFNLCEWVRGALQEGNIDMVVDPVLKSSVPVPEQEALWKVADIAMQCVEPRSKHRPTISQVIQALRQAMDLEGPLGEPISLVSPSSITFTKLSSIEQPPVNWSSLSFPSKDHLSILDSLSTDSAKETFGLKKQRRRKAFSCLGRLGCIPESAASMGKENQDFSTSTSIISHRSSWVRRRAEKSKADQFQKLRSLLLVLSLAQHESISASLYAHRTIHIGLFYNMPEIGRGMAVASFTLAEVTAMTRNFKTKIGKGGFGTVYYGKLPDGQEVAVKVGEASSSQGSQEFFNEIEILSMLRHKNLVALVGYCQEKKYQILIYEYMNNGSLRDHLSGNIQNTGMLDWKTRLRIALNTAQGVEYLHTGWQLPVIHRDVKSSNVVLSTTYDAKLTDFGLTKLRDQAGDSVTTQVKGTVGYLDPEYFVTNMLTTKSDIYGFGVVLLELLTGRPPYEFAASGNFNLCDWVRGALQEGNIDMVVDPVLKSSVPVPEQEALWKVADIAMQCVEPQSKHRPTISQVIQELRQAMDLEGRPEVPLEDSDGSDILSVGR